jgi:hypothetical protein
MEGYITVPDKPLDSDIEVSVGVRDNAEPARLRNPVMLHI